MDTASLLIGITRRASERFTIAHGGPELPHHGTSSLVASVGDLGQIGLLEPSVAAVFLALARARAASARIRQGSVELRGERRSKHRDVF